MKWLVTEWSTHMTGVYNESADLGQSRSTDVEIMKPPHWFKSLVFITIEKQMTTYAVDLHLPSQPLHPGLIDREWRSENMNKSVSSSGEPVILLGQDWLSIKGEFSHSQKKQTNPPKMQPKTRAKV